MFPAKNMKFLRLQLNRAMDIILAKKMSAKDI